MTPVATQPAVVTFRDADVPRPLAARIVAAAHQHPCGWTLSTPGARNTEHGTFETTVAAVIHATGVRHLLIVWFETELR